MASSSHNTFGESIDQTFDQYFDQHFDQTFENLFIDHGDQEDERKRRKKRVFIERNREESHLRLWNDYFSDTPTYPEIIIVCFHTKFFYVFMFLF